MDCKVQPPNMHRFLMLNYISKVFFSSYTYTFYLANAISNECLELTSFPWFLLYLLSNRIGLIGEISTFLCMSLAKVILNWRPDIYVKLNSSFTVNLATFFVIVLNLIDIYIRIDMHVFNDCTDQLSSTVYQVEMQRKFCVPDTYNLNDNSTICEIYEKTKSVHPIGCRRCPSYPVLRILLGSVLLLECMKFVLGFGRIAKKYRKKFKNNQILHPKKQPNSLNSTKGNVSQTSFKRTTNVSSIIIPVGNKWPPYHTDVGGVSTNITMDEFTKTNDQNDTTKEELKEVNVCNKPTTKPSPKSKYGTLSFDTKAELHQDSSNQTTQQTLEKNNCVEKDHGTSSKLSPSEVQPEDTQNSSAADPVSNPDEITIAQSDDMKLDPIEQLVKAWNDEYSTRPTKSRLIFFQYKFFYNTIYCSLHTLKW